VNSWSEVDTRALVKTLPVFFGAEDTMLDCCGVLDVGLALDWGGAALDFGGSEVAGSDGEFGVDTGGLLEDIGGRAEEVGGGGVLPVPVACRFWPWCRYASMPSIFRSSRLNADEKVARKARARESQNVRSMVDGGYGKARSSERTRGYVCIDDDDGPVGTG